MTGRALGLAYRVLARPRSPLSARRVLASARRAVGAKTYCLMVTGSGADVTARVVGPHHVDTDDFVLYVGTDPASRKVRSVRSHGRCLLVFERDVQQSCTVLDCTVDVLHREEAAAHFREFWSAFWPSGPDNSFVALRCRAERIEVWDGLRGVTPPPFGRRSAHLAWHGDEWVLEEDPGEVRS